MAGNSWSRPSNPGGLWKQEAIIFKRTQNRGRKLIENAILYLLEQHDKKTVEFLAQHLKLNFPFEWANPSRRTQEW